MNDPVTLLNRGNTLLEQGRLAEAEACYRRLLAIQPNNAAAHGNLGVALRKLGRHPEAEACFRRVLAIRPGHAGAHCNLGNLLQDLGRHAEAEACYRKALAIQPDSVEAHSNLGNLLTRLGRLAEAEASLRKALAIRPDFVAAHNNLGNVLQRLGRPEEAEICYRRALAASPGYAEAHGNLGNVLHDLDRFAEAEACYRRALALQPDSAEAHSNLGNLLTQIGRLAEAEAALHRALAIKPDFAKAHNNLGNVLKDLGRFAEAEAGYRRALALDPEYVEAHSGLLFTLTCRADCDAGLYRAEAVKYGQRVAAGVRERFKTWSCPMNPERLRVGLVSGDLRRHSVGYFLEGVLSHLDPARIELIAYPTVSKSDALTERLRPRFAAWRPLAGLGDEEAAGLIHDDGVHLLIDLSGHTAHNRLPVFAWKPAPVQATWLGYSATTGLAEIDWLIADPHAAPPDEAWQFTEQVWRLPESYLCFTPPDVGVAVGPLPALSCGAVTFCSFNNLSKVNEAVVALWSRVLQAVPGSRLFLKAKQLADPAIRETTLRRFDACGIGPERLRLEGPLPGREEHLAAYNRADIALDPFPYTGTTTCVEGLWMGVPFITRRGDRFLSHVGESIAHNAGLSEWIAEDEDDYVAKAIAFAGDLDRLAAVRAGLRERVLASPLFEAPRFARRLEDALWGMWEDRGKGQG